LTGGKNKQNIETVNVTGGTFNGRWGDLYSYGDTAKAAATITVKGGTFSDLEVLNYMGTDEFAEIKLAKDVELEKGVVINSGAKVTLDLNGHNIDATYTGTEHYGTFTIKEGAELTVNGTGNVTTKTALTTSNRSVATFANAGKLTINGGNYVLNDATSSDYTWIIAAIIDSYHYTGDSVATINGGTFQVTGNAINLFRNNSTGPNATSTLNIYDGTFNKNPEKNTYIWNHQSFTGAKDYMNFYGGTYNGIVYEDYYGQDDIYVSDAAIAGGLKAYSGNS